jgi:hypothetical protein
MRHSLRIAAVALLVAGASTLGLGAASAKAATIGPITISPSSGSVEDTLALKTSRGCPASADASKSRIVGPGFSKFGQNLSGVAPGNTSKTKPFEVQSAYTLKDTASLAYPPVTYKGTYRVEVVCMSSSRGEVGTFATTITFVDAVHWKVTSPTATVKPGPTVSVPAATQSPSSVASSPKPATATSASGSGTASPSASSSATGSDGSATSTDSTTGTDGTVTASSSDASSTPSWLPLVGGVVLGGAVVGGAMVLLQRRQNAGGSH